MASTVADFTLASWAAGFTLGFGLLTVWKAYKQTVAVKSPLRSAYIYMIWGEILANLCIAIVGWLFLEGALGPTVPVLFSLLFFWVFEVQLLMQIIINRIAVVVEDRRMIWKVKWGTAAIITVVNIAVFIIWIPAHAPPTVQIFVDINKIWDRCSKVIILIVDAGLNWYFLKIVKQRLVKYHGLTKYAPLVRFNARLMVISIAMDIMLIALMSLQNQVVYVQFHPVAYMIKLNIEMTMAGLITKIARGTINDRNELRDAHSNTNTGTHTGTRTGNTRTADFGLKSAINTTNMHKHVDRDNLEGIHTTKEVHIRVEDAASSLSDTDVESGYDHRATTGRSSGDLPLREMKFPQAVAAR